MPMVRVFAAVALCCVVAFTPACSRMVRSAARASRNNGNSSQNTPEDYRFPFVALDAAAIKKLNGYRATWSELVQKYSATELTGSEQVIAVLDGISSAHWSEKPRTEDVLRPIGTALGDAIRSEGGVDWVLINGRTIALGGAEGKVIVAPVDIAERWLANKTHPYRELIKEIHAAVREPKGIPAQIGVKEEDESGADMI